jgi:hypothetical protein
MRVARGELNVQAFCERSEVGCRPPELDILFDELTYGLFKLANSVGQSLVSRHEAP